MTGRLAVAEESFRKALLIREKRFPADHWRIGEAHRGLGECLLTEPRREVVQDLVRLYEARGDMARAEAFRAELE